MKWNRLSNKELNKLENVRQEMTVTCKCGHRVLFQVQTDRIICTYCGNWVYRTPKLEFEYKLKEKMKVIVNE